MTLSKNSEPIENALLHITEEHIHNKERWWGAAASPDENSAIANTISKPFVVVSGSGAYGASIPICGALDCPSSGSSNDLHFDMHRLDIIDNDHDTLYKMRLIYGAAGGSASAITAGQYTEFQFVAKTGPKEVGVPTSIVMPRLDVGAVVWAQVWNATNASEVDFYWGCHGYTE